VTGKFSRLLILIAIIAIPLAMSPIMADTIDLPKTALLYWLVIIFWTDWVLRGLWKGKFVWRRTPLDLPLIAFLVVGLLSTIFSLEPTRSFFGTYRARGFAWLPMFGAASLYWGVTQTATKKSLREVARFSVIAAVIAACYGLLSYAGIGIVPRIPIATGERIASTLGNAVFFGCFLSLATPVGFSLFLVSMNRGFSRTQSHTRVLLWITMFVILLTALLLTLTRSAWLGLAGAAVLFTVLFWKQWKKGEQLTEWNNCRAVRIFLTVGIIILVTLLVVQPQVRQRFLSLADPHDRYMAMRVEGWKSGMNEWVERPWLGTGPDTYEYAFRRHKTSRWLELAGIDRAQEVAHNDLFQFLVTGGVIGLCAYLWIWVMILVKGWRRVRVVFIDTEQKLLCTGLFAALAAFFIYNQFNFATVANMSIAAIFAGILFGLPVPETKIIVFGRKINKAALVFITLAFLFLPCFALYGVGRLVTGDIYYTNGLRWAYKKHGPYAVRDIQEALVRVPWNAFYRNEIVGVYHNWGMAAREAKDKEILLRIGLAHAEKNVELHPCDPDVHHNLGSAFMWYQQGTGRDMRKQAWTEYRRAVELDPCNVDGWANLAKLADEMGDRTQAIALCKKVLNIYPEHRETKKVLEKLQNPDKKGGD